MPIILAASAYSLATSVLLVLLPALYFNQSSRARAYSFIFIFYLALNWEEAVATQHFFGWSVVASLLVWVGHSLFMCLLWFVLYSKKRTVKNLTPRIVVLHLLLLLPPLGLFVWVQPIAGAGVLFPNAGFLGIVAYITLSTLLTLSIVTHKPRPTLLLSASLLLFSLVLNIIYLPPKLPANWVGINTNVGFQDTHQMGQIVRRQASLIQIIESQLQAGAKVIITPENIITNWLSGTQLQFSPLVKMAVAKGAIILLGVNHVRSSGSVESGFLMLGDSAPQFFPARQPMPLGEWNPLGKANYALHWFSPGIIDVKGIKAAYLICYEQMIPWPILYSLAQPTKPDVIISGANQWFTLKSGYLKQRLLIDGMARLFRLPLLIATNWPTGTMIN